MTNNKDENNNIFNKDSFIDDILLLSDKAVGENLVNEYKENIISFLGEQIKVSSSSAWKYSKFYETYEEEDPHFVPGKK